MPDSTEQENKSSRWTQAKGVAKAVIGTLLYVHPMTAAAAAAVSVGALAVKKFKDTDKTKGFLTRAKEATAMTAGAVIGSLSSVLGVGAVAAAGAAFYGNYEGAVSMGQGAMVGMAVKSVMLPVVSAAMVADGCYNAITGKESQILQKTVKVMKVTAKFFAAMVGVEDKSPEKPKEPEVSVQKSKEAQPIKEVPDTKPHTPDRETVRAAQQEAKLAQVKPSEGKPENRGVATKTVSEVKK